MYPFYNRFLPTTQAQNFITRHIQRDREDDDLLIIEALAPQFDLAHRLTRNMKFICQRRLFHAEGHTAGTNTTPDGLGHGTSFLGKKEYILPLSLSSMPRQNGV